MLIDRAGLIPSINRAGLLTNLRPTSILNNHFTDNPTTVLHCPSHDDILYNCRSQSLLFMSWIDPYSDLDSGNRLPKLCISCSIFWTRTWSPIEHHACRSRRTESSIHRLHARWVHFWNISSRRCFKETSCRLVPKERQRLLLRLKRSGRSEKSVHHTLIVREKDPLLV